MNLRSLKGEKVMLKTGKINLTCDSAKIASSTLLLVDIIRGEPSFNDREYLHYKAQLDFLYGADVFNYNTYAALCKMLRVKAGWE